MWKDGVFSLWNGHKPLSLEPPALRKVTTRETTSARFTRSFKSRRQVGLMTGIRLDGVHLMRTPPYIGAAVRKNALSTGPPRCQVSQPWSELAVKFRQTK